jgi:DNA topoisomerase IA
MARALVTRRHGLSAAIPPEATDPPAGGHEAIRPTSLDWPPERVGEALRQAGGRDLARLYTLIWERFIDSRMSAGCWRERPGRRAALTRPGPARLGDAALLEVLAQRGVGRPSTFASIGEGLEARGYLGRQGDALALTPLGRRVVAWLDRTFPVTLYAGFTADLESRLDEVEAGLLPWRSAVAAAWSPLRPILGGPIA